MYRQANPQATREQMIEELGPMVMIAAKVQPRPPGQQPNGGAGAPMTRQATGGRPPSPFKPAMGGPAAPPTPADDNPWQGLAPSDESE